MKREYLKNIKSENRIDRIRLIMPNDPVIGGQPSDNVDDFTSNTPLLDIASTMKFAIDSINKTESNANNRLEKNKNLSDLQNKATARSNLGLGASATLNTSSTLSDRTDQVATPKMVNDVNRTASTAQKVANNAYALAQSKQDKLDFVGNGKVIKENASLSTSLLQTGPYLWESGTADSWKRGHYGLTPAGKFGIRWIYTQAVYRDEDNEDGFSDVQIGLPYSNGLSITYRVNHVSRGWGEWHETYGTSNTSTDKSGFVRTKGNEDALVESDIANVLGNSRSLVASQELVNSINSKIKLNTISKSKNGWWKCGDTGLIYQWWTQSLNGQTVTSYPISFPNICLNVSATIAANMTAADSVAVFNVTKNNLTALAMSGAKSNTPIGPNIYFLAIGY